MWSSHLTRSFISVSLFFSTLISASRLLTISWAWPIFSRLAWSNTSSSSSCKRSTECCSSNIAWPVSPCTLSEDRCAGKEIADCKGSWEVWITCGANPRLAPWVTLLTNLHRPKNCLQVFQLLFSVFQPLLILCLHLWQHFLQQDTQRHDVTTNPICLTRNKVKHRYEETAAHVTQSTTWEGGASWMGKNVVWNVHSLLGEMQSDTKERRQHLKQKPFEQTNGQLAGTLHGVKPIYAPF